MQGGFARARGRDMHQPDRLFIAAAARTGDAGDRDRQLRRGIADGAFRHGAGHRFRDRAMLADQVAAGTPSKSCLASVGIGDKAALEDVRRAGDLGQQAGDQPAGAAFGRGDLQALGARVRQQLFGTGKKIEVGNITDGRK